MCHNGKWSCGPKCGTGMHMLSGLLWLGGVVTLVLAWLASRNGIAWGYDAEHWYQDVSALALLGVLASLLAVYHALKKCCGSCGDEKDGEGEGKSCCK